MTMKTRNHGLKSCYRPIFILKIEYYKPGYWAKNTCTELMGRQHITLSAEGGGGFLNDYASVILTQ